MLKGLGDLGNLMKMQKEMKALQKKIASTTVEGQSQDEYVTAVMNGEFKLVDIKLSDAALALDKKKLEKMILAAVTDAHIRAREFSENEMKRLAGGMDLGALGGLFK